MNAKMKQAIQTLKENGLYEVTGTNEKVTEAKKALETMHKQSLLPKGEYMCLKQNLNGEEGEAIAELILKVYQTFKTMPKTYETEATKEKIAYLHYFIGSWSWWVIEKDMQEDEQIQAFGFVTSDLCQDGEYGYIDITSITKQGAELDLYYTPQPVKKQTLG